MDVGCVGSVETAGMGGAAGVGAAGVGTTGVGVGSAGGESVGGLGTDIGCAIELSASPLASALQGRTAARFWLCLCLCLGPWAVGLAGAVAAGVSAAVLVNAAVGLPVMRDVGGRGFPF